jgi:glutathione S-transferase
MKLHYAPGACSLAAHIALIEAGLPYELARVDLHTHQTADGRDFHAINPKGYVPVLELDDGARLTEAAAVLQYIADRVPEQLAPPFGSFEHYRLIEWLNYISTELHKGFGPLWNPNITEEQRLPVLQRLAVRLNYAAQALERDPYLLGNRFSIADAYLFVILSWHKQLKVDLSRWPALLQFIDRVAARASVQRAMAEEGLTVAKAA